MIIVQDASYIHIYNDLSILYDQVRYCSSKCRWTDQAVHSKVCRPLQEIREEEERARSGDMEALPELLVKLQGAISIAIVSVSL